MSSRIATRDRLWLALGFLLLILLATLSMSVGGSQVGLADLLNRLFRLSAESTSTEFILWDLRLPRTLTCVAVGAALATSGALLQTVLDNPLSEPYTLGLSGASSLGGVLVFLVGLEPHWLMVPLGAFGVCWIATFVLIFRTGVKVGSDSRTLILSGVMISFLCSSIVSLLMSVLEPSKLQQAIFWMIGQVGSSRDQWWPITFLSTCLVLTWAHLKSHHFDRFLLGDTVAAGLGTPVAKHRVLTIVLSSWLTSVSVSQVGIMGFVGLLSPHFAQALVGHRLHRVLFPLSAALGGSILLAADVLGRAISQGQEIPAGSLVALVGAPIFLSRLLRGSGGSRVITNE